MRSLKKRFFIKMGVPNIREDFIRHTDAQTRVSSQTRSYRKLFFFFWAVTLHVSCCYGDASL